MYEKCKHKIQRHLKTEHKKHPDVWISFHRKAVSLIECYNWIIIYKKNRNVSFTLTKYPWTGKYIATVPALVLEWITSKILLIMLWLLQAK